MLKYHIKHKPVFIPVVNVGFFLSQSVVLSSRKSNLLIWNSFLLRDFYFKQELYCKFRFLELCKGDCWYCHCLPKHVVG